MSPDASGAMAPVYAAPDGTRLIRAVASLQLAVPMLTAGAFFMFRGDAPDLNNPNLPFAFRLLKDVVFAAAVFAPLVLTIFTRAVRIPPLMAAIWIAPVILALLMMGLGIVKAGPDFIPAGQLRNLGVYYVASGGMALLAWWRGYTWTLFGVFRVLIAFSVLLGLSFYAFADNILLFTIHGRMIGTLANPNFLGFLCFLWLAIIHADAARSERISVARAAELVLALAGLAGSASIAAILSFSVWWLLIVLLRLTGVITRSAGLDRAFALGGLLAAGGVVAASFLLITNESLEILWRIVQLTSGQSETSSVRLVDLGRTFEELIGIGGILIGQTTSSRYVQFDGTNQSYLFNFGLPFFLLWAAFICSPLLASVRAWKRWASRRSAEDWLAMMLVPFVVVSFSIEFWVQYVAEMYPTCVLFGFVMYFIILHAIPAQEPREAPVYLR